MRAAVPRHPHRSAGQIFARQRRQRNALHLADAQLRGERGVAFCDVGEHLRVVVHQVHLVDRQHHMPDAQQRHDVAMPAGLRQQALARIHQHHRHIGSRRAGGHVARVLLVPGAIGHDEFPPVCIEIAVGHIDGDALLAFGRQPIHQQCIVDAPALGAMPSAVAFQRGKLIVEQALAVVQQPPDQRALAVVHTAAGDEAQQRLGFVLMEVGTDGAGNRESGIGNRNGGALPHCIRGNLLFRFSIPDSPFAAHQKYPSSFFCSIEAPGAWSIMRPWRSELVLTSISAMTASSVSALESMAPVSG